MRAFLVACAAAVILAVIGGFALQAMQDNAADSFSTPYVRLGA
jgi:hypothetical protein